jgi:hypothetical protein
MNKHEQAEPRGLTGADLETLATLGRGGGEAGSDRDLRLSNGSGWGSISRRDSLIRRYRIDRAGAHGCAINYAPVRG